MASDGSKLLGEGKIVFHTPERHPTLEGPKFYKRDGWYYILAPAGGVETGWQVALRSRHIYGPYEDKIVLGQGSTAVNGPHQGALVDTPKGDWWLCISRTPESTAASCTCSLCAGTTVGRSLD